MNKDSAEILSILRKAEFGWIADELAESIALGKQVNREFREEGSRKKVRATSIEAFSAEEEITLIVTALVDISMIFPWHGRRRAPFFPIRKTIPLSSKANC